jgi:tetratricopeptide (TPR) repeat protein
MSVSRKTFGLRSAFQIVISTAAALIVVVAGGLECAAQNKDDKELPVDPFVTHARQRVEKAEWDLLIQDCNKVLETEPKKPNALLFRGIALNGKGEYDDAIKNFDQVNEQPGRDPVALASRADSFSNRSVSLYKKGEYLKAIDSAYFALLEKGDHAEAHNNRGMAYIGRKQYDKAIQSCDRAIQYNPKFAAAYSNRGYAYGAKGNFDQVIADQKKAIELDPGLAVAYQRRAGALIVKNDAKGALQDLDKAIQLQPDFVDALCDRAYLYALNGNAAKAVVDLDEAIKLNPESAKAHVQRGRAYLAAKNPEKAMDCLNEAVRLKDDYAEAYCYRGYAFQGKKDFDSALKDFSKAIALDPKLETAYSGRVETYKKLGKGGDGKADLAKLKELHPAPVTGKPAKKAEEPQPRFQVASKSVTPGKRAEALLAAKEIDRMVDANYAKTNTKPNPRTSDSQFVRRVYLDITGTIPTFQQTQRFLSAKEPDKRTLLIDELLNSDGYASHSFNYWADTLRYTDNLSNDVRGEPYRQWIKQSLAENKPWDKFVNEILTAEGLVWQSPMTGYLQRDSGMPLDNMNNTVRIFLGTRIGCAQCHNHPFDRWTQKEFYQMAAFTFGTQTSTGGYDKRYWEKDPNDRLHDEYSGIEQEEEDRRQNSYRFDRIISVNMRIVNDQVDRKIKLPKDYAYDDAKPEDIIEPKTLFGGPAEMRAGETPRRAFARWLTAKDNPRFALTIANRLWKQAFGIGQIEPVDDMMDQTVAENPALMQFLEGEMKRLNFDMKEYLRIIYNSAVYQREACADEVPLGEPYHFPGPALRRMTAEQVWDSFLTLAVSDPEEYRELPSQIRTGAIGMDLASVSAPKLLEAEVKGGEIDGNQWKRQVKYTYKGVLLARASELPSPVPAGHFLRIFGQSDRELISASSTTGSVPQILFMFNGPITHMLLEKNSTIYNNVIKKKTVPDGAKVVFLTILNREPDQEEIELAKEEIKKNGPAGYGNMIWSLVNTREFLFIQ